MRESTGGYKRWIRYAMVLVGVFLMGSGVAMMVKSNTGTSAIASLPTILNVIFPGVTLGTFMFLFNMIFFVGQFVVEPSSFRPQQLLQIIPTILLGTAVDINLWLLTWLSPKDYGVQLLILVCGILIFGLSIALMLSANVILMPIDSFISALTRRLGADWGNVKSGLDIALVVLSTIISVAVLHRLVGVREGTLIAAICVGQLSRLWRRVTDRLVLEDV